MKEKNQTVLFITETNFKMNTEIKHQLSSLVSKLYQRFPFVFESNQWNQYDFITPTEIPVPSQPRLYVCLGNEAYQQVLNLKLAHAQIIKIRKLTQNKHRCRVLDRMDRIRYNLRINAVIEDIHTQLMKNRPLSAS
jgi:hypothetical protein